MQGVLEALLPNLITRVPEFLDSIVDTVTMVLISGAISFVRGLIFGVAVTVTRRGGVLECPPLFHFLDKAINILRSVPFIILLTAVLPLTRAIVHTAIGVKGAIVPLVCGTVPFFSRQIQSALDEVNPGVIEAAQAMGLSPMAIIFKVYLKEGIPTIARATTLTGISLVGLTAMAGAVGAGGLGDFAIRLGHNRYMEDITWVTVITIMILVSIIQLIGDTVVRRHTR